MEKKSITFKYGEQEVTFETGEIARQADAAVFVSMGNTRVLVAVVANKKENPDIDFFPLMVSYQEKFYSTGRIPGGFLKREGRLSELETLTSRLIDRAIRPLFPDKFKNEVQITATVMSQDKKQTAEVAAMLGASAALTISGIPFNGPIAGAQVGYLEGKYELNPSIDYMNNSELILSLAGTEKSLLMVESEADELSEEVMLNAVKFGHEQMQVAIEAIKELDKKVGNPKWEWQAPETDSNLQKRVSELAKSELEKAYSIVDKTERGEAVSAIKEQVGNELIEDDKLADSADRYPETDVNDEFKNLQKEIVRGRLLSDMPRIDGRDTKTIRPIKVKCGVLPLVHGSALFTRGETQAIVVTTLGTERDSKLIDDAAGLYRDNFMLHYNFPSYSVGECGRNMGPGRREIGHGMLARRGISAVLPRVEDFPYTIRVVSEITESNGSSSMASVCGTSLALMDAGVPIASPVAGIAMGLIKEDEKYLILSDILGDEDHLGDMDFKVAGTATGITTMQMDIKIDGITEEIMERALDQAKVGRLHILEIMNQELAESRSELAPTAPRYVTIRVEPDKIGAIIGKGGAVIKKLQEDYECEIEIKDSGEVKVSTVSQEKVDACIAMIEQLVADVKLNEIYEGTVVRIVDFGAFVNVLPNKDGLLHISQISEHRLEKVTDELAIGDKIKVKVIKVDNQGRVSLSAKGVN